MSADKKIKICFYGVSTQLGGAERSLFDLVKNLGAHFEPWVLLPASEGPLLEAFRKIKVRVVVLPLPRDFLKASRHESFLSFYYSLKSFFALAMYGLKLRALLKIENPDLIHCTGVKCHLLGALVGSSLRKRVIWHIRDIFPKNGNTRKILRVVARLFRVDLVFNSKATQVAFSESSICLDRMFTVVYNGLPKTVFFPHKNFSIKTELKIPLDAPVIVNVGVLARWKGQLEFIEVAQKVLQTHAEVYFLIVGDKIYDTSSDENYPEFLRDEIANRGLSKRIFMLGFRPDIAELLNSVEMLVHTSIKPEPFGRVILEAMACGVPVVATRGGGVDEFVLDEKTGLLASPQNIIELTQQVNRLLDDTKLRAKLTEGGLDLFRKKFTIENHVEEMKIVFQSIVEGDVTRVTSPLKHE